MRECLRGAAWAFAIGLILAILFIAGVARAQDHAGHAQYHDAYQHWRQPGTSMSCCNAREVDWDENGTPRRVEGDCYPTEFRLTSQGWEGKLDRYDRWRFNGLEWLAVPDGRILREKNPDDSGRSGHLCTGSGLLPYVLCAVPPAGTL